MDAYFSRERSEKYKNYITRNTKSTVNEIGHQARGMTASSQSTVIECEYCASPEIRREICISIFLRLGNTFGNMECNNFDL